MPAIYRAGAESGYIEIIAMGARGRASADCPGRPARVPGYGGFFCVYRGRPGVHAAAAIKAGGRNAYVDSGDVLKVSYFIRDNATGVEFGDNAVRVSGFLAEAAITNQQYGVLSGDLNGLGFLEAFRTLCVSPPAEMKVLMDDMGILEKVGA